MKQLMPRYDDYSHKEHHFLSAQKSWVIRMSPGTRSFMCILDWIKLPVVHEIQLIPYFNADR